MNHWKSIKNPFFSFQFLKEKKKEKGVNYWDNWTNEKKRNKEMVLHYLLEEESSTVLNYFQFIVSGSN